MKKTILFLVLLLSSIGVFAQTRFKYGALNYEINNGNATVIESGLVSGTSVYSGDITIPSQVSYEGINYPVTSIGNNAFENCYGLTSVTIPNSITSICRGAFSYCNSLASVTIPNLVTSIGDNSFQSCSALTSVVIPNSVETIGNYAFFNCSGLTTVTLGNSVTTIGVYAFNLCPLIESMTVAAEVPPTLVNDDSFSDVPTTISVKVPCSSVSAYQNASGWSSFTNIQCPTYTLYYKVDGSSVTVYGTEASGRTGVSYDGSIEGFDIVIPESATINGNTYPVTSIGNYAFQNRSGLTSVTIGNSVTSIGNYAFLGCRGLTSVTIPNSVTSIGTSAFQGCSYLTSVTIDGNSLTTIGDNAFYSSGLTSITLPNSVTTIGREAFRECQSLESVNIPERVTIIGVSTFDNCQRLRNIDIPDGVTSIGNRAFSSCTTLTNITIPNSVTTIGEWAFGGCGNIKSFVIPSSVTSMGNYIFANCSNLSTIYDYRSDRSSGSYGLVPSRLVTVNDVDFSGTGVNQIVKIKSTNYTVGTAAADVIPMAELPINHIAYDGISAWKARSIVLTDSRTENNPFTCDEVFTATSVTYNRDFDDDRSSTVCLPFVITPAMRSAGNFKLHEFVSYNSSTGIATFSALSGETSSVANRPYIIEYNNAKGTFQMPTFSNVQFSATTSMSNPASSNGFHFEGTYDQRTMSNQNDTTFYGIYYGYFVRSNGEAKVNPFRGFFYTLDIPQGAPAPSGIDFQENEGNVGIELVDPSETIRYSNDVYDLSGRCVRKNADNLRGLSQGIYIWRGKKQLVH